MNILVCILLMHVSLAHSHTCMTLFCLGYFPLCVYAIHFCNLYVMYPCHVYLYYMHVWVCFEAYAAYPCLAIHMSIACIPPLIHLYIYIFTIHCIHTYCSWLRTACTCMCMLLLLLISTWAPLILLMLATLVHAYCPYANFVLMSALSSCVYILLDVCCYVLISILCLKRFLWWI